MAGAQSYSCSSYHSPSTGCPLGISLLWSPGSATPRNLLDKLGMSDVELQEQMKRWNDYTFNLGSGNLFNNYEEASKHLLERNLPDIANDCQDKAIFIPESDLPKVPRAVNVSLHNRDIDMEVYETRKRKLDTESAKFLQVREGTVEKQHLQGDFVERDLAEAIKAEFKNPGIEVVVLQGPSFRTPDSPKNAQEEHDIVVVHKKMKYIVGIESKRTLTPGTFHDAAKQLDKLRGLLNIYFGDKLKSGEWVFMGMVHFDQVHAGKVNLCPDCEKFALHKASQLKTKLGEAEALLKIMRPLCTPCHQEYKTVVKDLIFTTLAQPMNTKCRMVKAVHEKIIGKKAKKKGKDDVAGQGDIRCILFWTVDQANLMLSPDVKYLFVVFISSWSTGKTLCMRERARRRALQFPGQQVCFFVMGYWARKTLLELELKQMFSDLSNVTVMGIQTNIDNTDGLEKLEEAIQSQAGSSSFFIDEFVLPEPEHHSSFTAKLQQLVHTLRTHHTNPLFWITIAGIYEGDAEHFEVDYLRGVLGGQLHIVEGMTYPLRNSLATLRQAGLESGNTAKPVTVVGNCQSNVRLSIPPGLIGGVEGNTYYVKNKDDRGEVEDKVRQAREDMADRLGNQGVAVLCCVSDSKKHFPWIQAGLRAARPTKQSLIYTYNDAGGQSKASEDQVGEWLQGGGTQLGDKDMITDEYMSRGWEAREVLVVDLMGFDRWKNLVMRSTAYSVAVICKSN